MESAGDSLAFSGVCRCGGIHILRQAVQGQVKPAMDRTDHNLRPLIAAGTLMGIGLGGFFDGIVFHELLQVHNMLSNWVPRTTLVNEEINMFWDGLFHVFCYLATLIALWMLWRVLARPDVPLSGRTYFGALWIGWGVFNLVEGLVDHELLQVHHVYQNDPARFLLWDMLFLASGVFFPTLGWLFIRNSPASQLRQDMSR
jgi:uncharacterized membrane protein